MATPALDSDQYGNWRPVVGFEGYDVSDLGFVRTWRTTKPGILRKQPVLRRIGVDSGGYHYVALRDSDGKRRNKGVHVLVLDAFVGPCPEDMEARHFPDRDKANNRLTNLSWGTLVENWNDKRVHGTACIGSKAGRAKLVEGSVRVIQMLMSLPASERPTRRELASTFGVSTCAISRANTGFSWKHLAEVA